MRNEARDRSVYQVRDSYARQVEAPQHAPARSHTRFGRPDRLAWLTPDHALSRALWYDYSKEQPRPAVALAAVPAGVPGVGTFRQVEQLRHVKAIRQLVSITGRSRTASSAAVCR